MFGEIDFFRVDGVKQLVWPLALILCVFFVANCHAASQPAPPYAVRQIRSVSYGPAPEEIADLCVPDMAYVSAPAIVFLHGGDWIKGARGQFDLTCQAAAQRGIVGMTVQYRLAPANIWPAQLEDVQLAMRWLRAHAKDYRVDPGRICSWGSSAGAHLAVFLGVAQTRPGDRADLYADQSSKAACVVDDFAPVDLTNAGRLRNGAYRLVGSDSADALRDASPLFLVDAHAAPMLIVQGDADPAVDRDTQSAKLYQALKQHGIPAQMLTYSGSHAFKGLSEDEKQHYQDLSLQFVLSTVGGIRF